MELKQALEELRKSDKRKFEQGVDLIVNLKGINLKKENITTVVTIPHKIKEKKVCAFLTKKSSLVDTITLPEFQKYKDKKEIKSLVKNYDFFMGVASLMPGVASTFGKVLGPAGKMPSPQLGILMQESDAQIQSLLERISKSIKVRAKEASIKVLIGKEKMSDEEIIANASAVYRGLVEALPSKKENVKNVLIKLTMSKPLKVEMK